MVKRLDEALGRLLDALLSLDLLRNTIVVSAADHGCHFRTRNKEYKRSCHDSSIRVLVALQGTGFDGGGHVRQLVSLVDVAPTLLDTARLHVPAHMQGRSLMPVLRREPVAWPDDVLIQISESQVGRAIRTARWKYGVTAPDQHPSNVSAAARYVEEYQYDLEADPYELNNLVGRESHRAVANVLRDRLTHRMTTIGEAPPTIGEAPPTIEPALPRAGEQYAVTPQEAHM